MSDSAEQAARDWLEESNLMYYGEHAEASGRKVFESLAKLLREREEAAFKAGAEAMREKARAMCFAKRPENTISAFVIVAECIRALSIPEPSR